MPGPITASLNGLTFGDFDADGIFWTLGDVEGWDSPAVRLESSPRVGEAGVALTAVQYLGRPITVSGWAACNSLANMWKARARLAKAADLVLVEGTLVVNETTPKQAFVRRAAELRMRQVGGVQLEWELPLLAPDPRKYLTTMPSFTIPIAANTNTTPNTIVTNTGDVRSPYWTVTITGAGQDPRIANNTDNTKSVQVLGSFTASDTVVIDSRPDARTVTLNGVDRYDLISQSSVWFDLLPGNNSIDVFRSTIPATAMNFLFARRDAWL